MEALESRLPVGSSAKMSSGRVMSARAQATRCCWPPDSSLGRWARRSAIPSWATSCASHASVHRGAGEVGRQGDVLGGGERRDEVERLEHEPDPVAPQLRSARSPRALPISSSPMKACPEVGASSPAMQCISVDLPDPDGPMTAVKRPRSNADGDPGQRGDGGVARAVRLGQLDGTGSRRGCPLFGVGMISVSTHHSVLSPGPSEQPDSRSPGGTASPTMTEPSDVYVITASLAFGEESIPAGGALRHARGPSAWPSAQIRSTSSVRNRSASMSTAT